MTDQHVASIDHPHDYVNAVQRLQELLGVAPDGLIGPVTRAAATAVGFANRELVSRLETIIKNQEKIMSALTDLQASLTKYIADVEAFRQTVKTAVADALAADEAGEDSAITTMKATIDAADASLTPPAVTPPATP